MLGRGQTLPNHPGLEVWRHQPKVLQAQPGRHFGMGWRGATGPRVPPTAGSRLGTECPHSVVTSTSEEFGTGIVPRPPSPTRQPRASPRPSPSRGGLGPGRAPSCTAKSGRELAGGSFPIGKVPAHGVLRLPAWAGTVGAPSSGPGPPRLGAPIPAPPVSAPAPPHRLSAIPITAVPGVSRPQG